MQFPKVLIDLSLLCFIVSIVNCIECPAYCNCDSSSIVCNKDNEQVSFSHYLNKIMIKCIGVNSSGLELLPVVFVNESMSELDITNCTLPDNKTITNLMENFINIELMKLSFRKFEDLEPYLLQNLNNLKIIELRCLESIVLKNNSLSNVSQLEELRLFCNHSIKINELSSLRNIKRLSVYQIYEKYKIKLNLTSVNELDLKHFKCNGCDLAELSVEMTSGFKELQTLTLINCGITLLTESFFSHSKNINDINLSNNTIESLHDDLFKAQKQLTNLDLSNNQISNISASSISDITSLRILKMSFNAITNVHEFAFQNLKNLEELHLDNNQLTRINLAAAKTHVTKLNTLILHHNKINYFFAMNMRNLTYLDLSYNEIVNFGMSDWSRISAKKITLNLSHNLVKELNLTNNPHISVNSTTINLSYNQLERITLNDLQKLQLQKSNVLLNGNPWTCDCTLVDLMKFVNIIKDYNELSCFKEPEKLISMLKLEDICFVESQTFLLFCGIAMLVICSLTSALFFRYRWNIRRWLHLKELYKNPQLEAECNSHKEFDAFVMYSKYDQDFVENQLTINLEEIENPYKLCIHVRDFEPGEQIMTNIYDSIDKSRRAIIVMTPNFLESNWTKAEFKLATTRAIDDPFFKVIIIMLKSIDDIQDVSPDIKEFIKLHTYIEYNDGNAAFWKKLKKSLPIKS